MDVLLTQYSHGAGCGCKISPSQLDIILDGARSALHFQGLVVGQGAKDDAAAFDLGDGRVILSTTDFFMPIVDDPRTFGQIAATNALSDIYAMGGQPMMAIAILGWPLDKLGADVAAEVVAGGRQACEAAGIPLAGGHSIDAPEPIFGLAVTGIAQKSQLKTNAMAEADCAIFLTKPLGVGILTTAQKQQKIRPEDLQNAINTMCQLNKIGADLATLDGVSCITDVTGFGLLGHLLEICEASHITAVIDTKAVPLLPNVLDYLQQGCVPGGTMRNWQSVQHQVAGLHGQTLDQQTQRLLCDPQTSGGLLVMVRSSAVADFQSYCRQQGLELMPIGKTLAESATDAGPRIEVI
jgi:selenide,water dikinase